MSRSGETSAPFELVGSKGRFLRWPRFVELRVHLRFVVHEHHASHLHYDLRLERDGVLCSWAIPKGPSMDAAVKRLAIEVEDHALEYADFEGIIPEGRYGAGVVVIWDNGVYKPVDWKPNKIGFILYGTRLRGGFTLMCMKSSGKAREWLLIKSKDKYAVPGWRIEPGLTPQRKAQLIGRELSLSSHKRTRDLT
jgi:bifunctional non-homologous end joining protein LigD